jgi:hypothetical protein
MQPHEGSGARNPKKQPNRTSFWLIVVIVGLVAWITVELVERWL